MFKCTSPPWCWFQCCHWDPYSKGSKPPSSMFFSFGYTPLYLVVRSFFSCSGSFCCSCVFFLVGFSWRSAAHLRPWGQSVTQSTEYRHNLSGKSTHTRFTHTYPEKHLFYLEWCNCLVISLYQCSVIPYIWIITLEKRTTDLEPLQEGDIFHTMQNKTETMHDLIWFDILSAADLTSDLTCLPLPPLLCGKGCYSEFKCNIFVQLKLIHVLSIQDVVIQ